MKEYGGKTVLITGVSGTVGQELLAQIHQTNVNHIIGVDINEGDLFDLVEEYRSVNNVSLFLADINDRSQMDHLFRGVDIVLHAAAVKHVILCEKSPGSAVASNILGTQNIIAAALTNRVERVLFTSSDKAVNPTNVMGASKLMCERLVAAANIQAGPEGPIFASTRFGNVLGSRGSVVPLFRRQIAAGGPVTLTDSRMTRFIMTLHDACHLVLESTFMAIGGEVFVTKMPVCRIVDLVEVMINELAPQYGHDPADIVIETIGAKAGEKMYEELMNDEECRRTTELDDYFVIQPAFESLYGPREYEYESQMSRKVDEPYNSSTTEVMSQEKLRDYLISHKII